MDKVFLQACRGEKTSHTPIWLNRQAGRYMPEYHQVKADLPSLDFFKNPEKAAQATLDAQRILGVDAAIMFADLLPILEPMGLNLEYVPGQGPVFDNPIRTAADVANLATAPAIEHTPYIADTVRCINEGLPKDIALIGFAGAPFTLASYAIEGKGSRNYVFVKKMMYEAPELWHELMTKLTGQLASYLQLQISAGVEAVQLFDTWVGNLSIYDYRTYVERHLKALVDSLAGTVPIIYFGTGNYHLLPAVNELNIDVLAFDWRTPLKTNLGPVGLHCSAGQPRPHRALRRSSLGCLPVPVVVGPSRWPRRTYLQFGPRHHPGNPGG